MQVKLKVIGGKNDGREIKIAVPEFIIGRGDEAHLKPSSDLISRKHCTIAVRENQVIITDLGSRNGTFINGEAIQGEYVANVGDVLRVARLQFEVLIDVTQPSAKRPKVEDVAAAVSRTAESARKPAGNLEESISDWLSDDVDADAEKSMSDTTQLSLEDTKAILLEAENKARDKDIEKKSKSDSGVFPKDDSDPGSKGKLPPLPRFSHDSSKGAADDVLRKFFNRR